MKTLRHNAIALLTLIWLLYTFVAMMGAVVHLAGVPLSLDTWWSYGLLYYGTMMWIVAMVCLLGDVILLAGAYARGEW